MRATQEAVLAEMRRWGYRYVVTPSLENLEVLALGLEADQRRRLFKLSDGDGSLLALVGERTVPVARLAAGKLRAAPLPLRLCYAGSVLTNDPDRFTGRREAYQVGAELIGASGAVADAEVIAMACRCLEAAGLHGYQVDVGHSGFFQGLLDGLELPRESKSGIKSLLARRDFVGLEALLEQTPLRSAEHDLLLRFPALRGGADILEAAGKLPRLHPVESAQRATTFASAIRITEPVHRADVDEALERSEDRAVDHHRRVLLVVGADVLELEALRHLVVELHRRRLELAAERVGHLVVDLPPRHLARLRAARRDERGVSR